MQRDRLDAKRFELVFEQAESGNVGAQRLLNQMIEKNDMMSAAARLRDAQGEGDAHQPQGKKAQERKAARDVSGGESGWGDDLKPGVTH